MGTSGSAARCSEHPIALPRPLQHPQNRGKPCTERPPKETAPLRTHSVPLKPLGWTRSGYFIEEIAGGVQDFIGCGICGPVGLGWDGAGRREASGKQVIPSQVVYQHSQMLCLPSLSFSTADRHLQNIKSSKPGWERGRRALHRSLLSFGAARLLPLHCVLSTKLRLAASQLVLLGG